MSLMRSCEMTSCIKPVLSALSIALVLTAAAGCPGDVGNEGEGEGEGGEGEGEGDISADAQAICEVWQRGSLVFTVSIISQFGLPARCAAADLAFTDPAQFEEVAAEVCAAGAALEFQQGIDGGRVTFNRANIEACAALDLAELAAGGATALPAECERAALYTSNVAEGGVCVQDWDCVDGTACEAEVLTVDEKNCLAPGEPGDIC